MKKCVVFLEESLKGFFRRSASKRFFGKTRRSAFLEKCLEVFLGEMRLRVFWRNVSKGFLEKCVEGLLRNSSKGFLEKHVSEFLGFTISGYVNVKRY